MKIKIITNRRPFVNGRKTEMGEIVDVPDEVAEAMMANEFAQRLEAPKATQAPAKIGKPKKNARTSKDKVH